MSPLDIPINEKSHGALSLTRRSESTAIIRIGTSQSARSSLRARSKPLSESFAPRQLTCTQGRKKQIRTNKAAPSVVRLALSTRIIHRSPGWRLALGQFHGPATFFCLENARHYPAVWLALRL
jgi:hypothetical protein